jgi:hypothetical protein
MARHFSMRVAVWAALFAAIVRSNGAEVMTYIYNAPESEGDTRYVYHWEILRTALAKTRAKYGPYRMKASELMTEQRQAFELKKGSGKLSVMYLSTVPDFERNLVGIHIPVDKNLGGYCVFLIRTNNAAKFRSVRTVNDLRKFSYGQGLGWIDVDILKSNRFTVVTGSSYEGLFEMVAAGRFDVFLRATTEVLDEYDVRKRTFPELEIEPTICFYYPLPMYFWFSKNEQGRALAKRAEEGMWMMINDGTYDRIFDRYQRWKIERLRLKERRLFEIKNPFLGPETPFGDKRLWFDPQTYK